MANQPRVACIVLNWNGVELLPDCMASLQASTYSAMSIIVVDNGSTDDSLSWLRANHPEVHIIENGANLHWAAGNNEGIKYALQEGFDHILLLNNDIVVAPDMVEKLVAAIEKEASTGVVGPKIYYHREPNLIWFAGGRMVPWQGRIWHIGIREADKGQFDEVINVDYITGCALMVRRELFGKVGLIDTAFAAYGEDVDLCRRAAGAGYGVELVPGATMWHKVSSSYGITSRRKVWLRFRSNLRLYRRYAPKWAWFTTIPLYLIFEGIRVAVLYVGGKFTRRG